MHWTRIAIPLLILALFGGSVEEGVPYQLFPLKWEKRTDLVSVQLTICPTGMPAGMAERFKDAGAAWNTPYLQVSFAPDSCDPACTTGACGRNDIRVGSTSGLGHMGTMLFARGGFLAACHIIVNEDEPMSMWYTAPDGTPVDQFDVWTLAMHELGHCLGLQHEDAVPSIMRTLIHRQEVQHAPSPDDQAGIAFLYAAPAKRSAGCGRFF